MAQSITKTRSSSELQLDLQKSLLRADSEEYGNSVYIKQDCSTAYSEGNSHSNSSVKQLQAGLNVQLEHQEYLWLTKMRELLCDDAVDSSGYCKKYKNNLIRFVNYPKIRAAKPLEPGCPSKNLWMNSHSQWFLYLLIKKPLPHWALFLEEELSLLPTFQIGTADIIAKPKYQTSVLFNHPKFLH